MAAPILPPVVQPPAQPPTSELPDWLKIGAGLLIVGAFVEAIAKVSPRAAYTVVLLALLGFAATGGKLKAFTDGLKGLGLT